MKRVPGAIFLRLFAGCFLMFGWAQPAVAQVQQETLWRDAVVTELDVNFGDTGFHARWRLHRCDCGDLFVEVEQVAPDGTVSGELLMINGKVLLARDFELQDVDIEPLIQAPSLMLQLAFSMLNRSQPKGPFVVTDKQLWDEKEKTMDFKLNTGLASGIFAAPWAVRGAGWQTDSGHRRFELLFQFSNPMPGDQDATESITLSGNLDFQKQDFPFDDSTSLEGWSIQWTASNDLESEPAAKGLTLKELRQKTKDQ